jgi:hypothetical protein
MTSHASFDALWGQGRTVNNPRQSLVAHMPGEAFFLIHPVLKLLDFVILRGVIDLFYQIK